MADVELKERKVAAWGMDAQDAPLAALEIPRRGLRADDVAIRIDYCGVCHSDLHYARNDWGNAVYPAVPGHEIVGTVTAVGPEVSAHKVGDRVAVGCMVDSCLECAQCEDGHEEYCFRKNTGTYGGRDRVDGSPTYGGYSDSIVVKEHFVLRMPDGLDAAKAGPLLCAGITMYSPLKHWGVGEGTKLGVVGLGGLGHMAVKLGAAMGAEVTVFTTSPEKVKDAEDLGAHHVVLSRDGDQMKAARGSLDIIIDSVPVAHDLHPYINSLKVGGTLVIVGAIEMLSLHGGLLIRGRTAVAGSVIGGIADTQELLDLCAEKQIYPEVEMIRMDEINEAWERMEAGDVKYRFVVDMGSLRGSKKKEERR